ncbi:GNAT family N-acetyltransferase [Streptomyces sp. SID3343]|uniref:GNAT family N-acetyltransferase n=1 Tax=Streptomyces sp. SID3343 TaxID=2690260 RepID=UPI00136DB02B|nr:GNAT family N-acetyltransferase [Streptomyces sp. SID3343]
MTSTPQRARGGCLSLDSPDPRDPRERAAAAAERATQAAGVEIRELHSPADMFEACRLFERVWRTDSTSPLMTIELMLVLAHCGGYVVGGYEGGRMTAAAAGLLTPTGLHSHIAGVDEGSRGRDIGYALKTHQRAWCLAHDITEVTWTYDPLVGRNAWFNLAKLGAIPVEYLPNFYGRRSDGLNGDAPSDRLLVRWDLSTERVALTGEGVSHGIEPDPVVAGAEVGAGATVVGLDAGPDGRPIVGRLDGDVVLVRVPRDIETLRGTDPDSADAWRMAMRDVLGVLMAEGRAVWGFSRQGWYVVGRSPQP